MTDDISGIIRRQVSERPDKTALITDDARLSYAELDDQITRCARWLADRNVGRARICGMFLSHPFLSLVVRLSLARLRVGSVVLTTHAPRPQLEDIVQNCPVDIVVADGDVAFGETPVIRLSLEAIGKTPARALSSEELGSGDIEIVTPGSGSTGKPKLIGHPFGGFTLQAQRLAVSTGYDETEIVLSLPQIYFSSALRRALAAFECGATFYLSTRTGIDFFRLVKALRITAISATPAHAEAIISLGQNSGGRLDSVRIFELGSGLITNSLLSRLKAYVPRGIQILYSANECPTVSTHYLDREPRMDGGVGRPVAEAEVEIVDDAGEKQPAGVAGHIRMRVAGMMSGYLGDPENTARAVRDGWFYPGDTGKLTEDGQLIHLGRSDHMMIFDGINIYPAEIENTVARHPDVRDVAVMPLRHRVHQDFPVCCVALQPGATATEDQLMQFAAEQLGARRPREVFIVEAIPRSEFGKLIRKDLATLISDRLRKGG